MVDKSAGEVNLAPTGAWEAPLTDTGHLCCRDRILSRPAIYQASIPSVVLRFTPLVALFRQQTFPRPQIDRLEITSNHGIWAMYYVLQTAQDELLQTPTSLLGHLDYGTFSIA
jgi:hypothetical protein